MVLFSTKSGAAIGQLDGKRRAVASIPLGEIQTAAFSPDSTSVVVVLALADEQSLLLFIDPLAARTADRIKFPRTGRGGSIAFSRDGKLLATSSDSEILLWNTSLWRVNLGETGGGDRNGMRRPVAASSSCRFVPAASGFAIPRDA